MELDSPQKRSLTISLRKVTYSAIFAGVAYLAMGLLTDIHEVLQAISVIPIELYCALLGLALASYLARLLRWISFLRPLYPQISLRNHAVIYFSGFALTMTPAKAGETIRSLYLHPLGVPYTVSLASFFSERILDLLTVSALVLLAIGAITSVDTWFFTVISLLLLLFFFVRSRLMTVLIGRLERYRAGIFAGELQYGISQFLGNRSLATALPISAVAWLCQGLVLVLIVNSIGFEAKPEIVIGVYCLSILIGAASFIPGGIGATEAAITLLLTGMGMDPAQAVAAAVVCRVVTLWFAIAIGIAALNYNKQRRVLSP